MAMTTAERLKRKRECEKKRRALMKLDPEVIDTENEKRRLRYRKKMNNREIIHENERTKRITRRKWRETQRKYRARKKALADSGMLIFVCQ